MARSGDPINESEIWGTWEDLLLACSVHRHGTTNWDSVSMEIRSRSPYPHLFSNEICKNRYFHLKRRFSNTDVEQINGEQNGDDESTVEIPWVEELRKLRVAELRREVQRYDVSIGSLQLKVKRLKEERERSLLDDESDLKKDEDDDIKHQTSSPRSEPLDVAVDRTSGQDSGGSCKESNSTDPKEDEEKTEDDIRIEPRSEPIAGAEASSYNGSSDTIAKGAAAAVVPPEANTVNESGESVAESKGGEAEGAKENSDVQSSASLNRRRRRGRRRKVTLSVSSSGGGGGDEPEADAISPVGKLVDAELQPLINFLDTIRSSEYGSMFVRRLESQETDQYRNLIRRHVDLEMIRSKIGKNGYTNAEFFRDLLLLCNNAIVFYPKNSAEAKSAIQIRNLIGKEMSSESLLRKMPKPSPVVAIKDSSPLLIPPPPALKTKPDPDRATSVLEKPPSVLPPLVACRKRSSIATKPPPVLKKIENVEKEEKPEIEVKQQSLDNKKSIKQQRSALSRGLRTNKPRGGSSGSRTAAVSKIPIPPVPVPDPVVKEEKPDRKTASATTPDAVISTAKKRSAANFLNRMKRSSPSSSNGTLLETLKSSSGAAAKGGGGDQKKGSRGEGRKEAGTKRSVGRPPKRAAAMPASKRARDRTPPATKRAREKSPPPARKRGRR